MLNWWTRFRCEYVDGQTLGALIAGRPIEAARTLDLAIQVADALDEAHTKGITHRDLKPANIMIGPKGQAKVLDFGLAKMERPLVDAPTESVTEAGMVVGTLQYMSPEQVMGRDLDRRSDIFSLGVVLYEMATGRRPFAGSTGMETIDRIAHSQPEAIARFNYEAPVDLERIVRKCLEKEPERRYQSARELVVDLKNLQRDSSSGTAQRIEIGRVSRRSVLPWIAVALLVAGGAGGYWWMNRPSPSPPMKSLAILPLKMIQSAGKDDYLGLGIADTMITKVSQIRGLTVRPSSAVRKYAAQETEALQAARQLQVDAVLDGTLQRSGERLRVSVNLLRASDGTSLWAETFDVPFSDIFAVQDEVSREVASRLRVELSAREREGLAKRTTTSTEAYEYYLAGMRHLDERTLTSMGPAIPMFEKAIEIDPNYGLAYAQLAYAYGWMGNFIEPNNTAWVERARKALARADALDPNLAETHVARHELLWSAHEGFQIAGAIRELRQALQLNPSVGRGELGILYSHLGLEGPALREMERQKEIDPTSVIGRDRFAESKLLLGRYDDDSATQRTSFSATVRASIALAKNRLDEAEQSIVSRLASSPGDSRVRANWALLLALRGRYLDAEAEIPRIRQGQRNRGYHHATFDIACVYALQGKSREAVEWLRLTADTGMPNYTLFTRAPHFDRIRKEPAFVDFMAGMKARYEQYQREFP